MLTGRRPLLLAMAGLLATGCRPTAQDPGAGEDIDVPPERPGRNFPEAAEAEERREREADYSDASAPRTRGGRYEPAPYAGTSLPKPGTSNVTPDTEVTYGRPDTGPHHPRGGAAGGGGGDE
ncbi:hypothetical protein [Acetobacter nitrogenifigens]|uniref:Lipoprotein n=2 Tax=Acetobacter nitrogenifigens TaxID=285268 RepID=A0A511X9L8_9PROT|nr:hypothetical protein [Acetobacter nitrogenifigens]GEN59646.1 hypothetical protein ANI02nite_15300 [Acetobacter nitrogenifigens DSM 23921 = NBRC 105050]